MDLKILKKILLILSLIVLTSYILDIFNLISIKGKFNTILQLLVILIFIISYYIGIKSKHKL